MSEDYCTGLSSRVTITQVAEQSARLGTIVPQHQLLASHRGSWERALSPRSILMKAARVSETFTETI